MIKEHIWLLDQCKILLRISVHHERAVLIGPSKGRSFSSSVGRPFESRIWIGRALADRLSFGHPTAELCYVGTKKFTWISLKAMWIPRDRNHMFIYFFLFC